jgi:hypothetical protein
MTRKASTLHPTFRVAIDTLMFFAWAGLFLVVLTNAALNTYWVGMPSRNRCSAR